MQRLLYRLCRPARENRHFGHGAFPSHGERGRQGIRAAALRAGTDAARQPSRPLGFRPCDHHERRDDGPVQGNRALRGLGPRAYRAGLFRRVHQPHRCLRRREPRHAEVPAPGLARAVGHAPHLRGGRERLRAAGLAGGVQVVAVECRVGHVLPQERRAGGRGVHSGGGRLREARVV